MKTKLMIFCALIASTWSFAQPTDSTYFYLNDSPFYVCQQPDICSFKLLDNSEYTGTLDPSVVLGVDYFSGEGIHYIHFTPTATTFQKALVASQVESEPLFEKFYMVGTKSVNFSKQCGEGMWMGTDNQITIVFEDEDITNAEVDAFATSYETNVIYYPTATHPNKVFVLEVDKQIKSYPWSSPTLSIDIAKDMWENDSALLKAVTPSLRIFRPDNPDDPRYSDLWWAEDDAPYLCNGTEVPNGNGIDLDCAWNFENEFGTVDYFSGEGIVVGVIDFDGAEYTHPDCIGMYDNGYVSPSITSPDIIVPITGDTYISSVDNRAHLHAVSGVIGARIDNAEGSAGVAHNSTIMPLLFRGTTAQFNTLLDKAFAQIGSDEVDIINMSFGFGGMSLADAAGFPFYGALSSCVELGRSSDTGSPKGMILVASAGNSNGYAENIPAAIPFVFSVGGTNPNDERWSDGDGWGGPSSFGATYFDDLDVSAPAICVTTTDFTDDNHPAFPDPTGDGYVVGDYYSFLGTSAAAPIVSGIAALVLEKDDNLMVEDVYDIIRFSCEKVGGYAYSSSGADGKSLELGYGRVNACLALQNVDNLSTSENEIETPILINNPVTDILTLTIGSEGEYDIFLVNIMGQTVYQSINESGGTIEIPMSNYSDGMYLLKIKDNITGKETSNKVIKK